MLLLILPATYLHFRYLRRKPELRRWRYIYWVFIALMVIGTLWYIAYGFRTGRPEWLSHLFFHLWLVVSISQLALSIGGLLSSLFKRIKIMSRAMTCLGIVLAAFTLIITVMAYMIGNKRIEVKEYSFASKDLPEEFDGFRIVHISDLHLGTYGNDTARVAQLIDKTLEQQGDIILFTGDLVNMESKSLKTESKSLETKSKSLENDGSRLLDFFSTELDYFSTELKLFSRGLDKNIRIMVRFCAYHSYHSYRFFGTNGTFGTRNIIKKTFFPKLKLLSL